jgi:hypothetical protein
MKTVKYSKWILLLTLASCKGKTSVIHHPEDTHFEDLSLADPNIYLSHTQWLDKVARQTLGKELSAEAREHWATQSKDEFLDYVFSHKDFADFLMRLNLYYLQASEESGYDDMYNPRRESLMTKAYQYPATLHSVREYFKNGDYLKLFDLHVQPMQAPLTVPYSSNASKEDVKADRDHNYRLAYEFFSERFEELRSSFEKEKFCIYVVFLPPQILTYYQGIRPQPFSSILHAQPQFHDLMNYCDNEEDQDVETLIQMFDELIQAILSYRQILDPFEQAFYNPKSFFEIKPSPSEIGMGSNWESFTPEGLWQRLKNSSTNFNRRRAAYVLKTYFCDDLQPIDVISPIKHSLNKHASDPSCQSCHYRLDPLAGVFRNFGYNGNNFEDRKYIYFDDFAKMDRASYENEWRDSSGVFNTGYVRSVEDSSLNHYFSDLEGLSSAIREIPETKKCLTRRIFEFVTTTKVQIDGQYLENLSKRFQQDNSSEALRSVLRTVFLSNSYSVTYPDSNSCYDFLEGTDSANRVPCQISANIQRNCHRCHNNASSLGGLNLEKYDERGFVMYEGEDRLQSKDVLTRMLQSLQTKNPEKRMPYKQHISAQDYQELQSWIVKELN